MAASRGAEEDTLDERLQNQARIVELDGDSDADDTGVPFPGKRGLRQLAKPKKTLSLPPWMTDVTLSLFPADLATASTEALAATAAECLPLLTLQDSQGFPANSYGLPHLARQQHAAFLNFFLRPLPGPYEKIDASRPWMLYWCIAGLSFLGEDVSVFRERLVETLRPLQNVTGGFGGGHGHLSHCAASYAAILALAAVGALEAVDRKALWHWLGRMKQPSGGFRMAEGAEEDIRGAYCAMTLISLLNLPTSLPDDAPARDAGLTSFLDGLGAWIARCQTFEGGIAGAPTNEAHGAYAFCALACLSIVDAPAKSIPAYLDVDALVSCLASLQTVPEGGFAGRSNKLVDACYSHWVGSCWSLLDAVLPSTRTANEIWNPPALVRYLLTCAQQPGPKGGMRDKPSTRPDAYHTCYSLSGLSAAMNTYHYDATGETVEAGSGRLVAPFNWSATGPREAEMEKLQVDEKDVVVPIHPVFVLRFEAAERAKRMFQGKPF